MSDERARYPVHLYPGCPCYACDSLTWPRYGTEVSALPARMSLCPRCGSKRCEGAVNHRRNCTDREAAGSGSLKEDGQ
jgi:hypothetical protein